ncbi:MAG: PIG-L deacetylase family protein [Verrucomicrobiota bacterium]
MPAVLALAAHPDDIEFCMAGTLLRLQAAGWEVHCCNVARGNLGGTSLDGRRTAAVRRREAQAAARALGARWHPPCADDLAILYTPGLLRRLAALVRAVKPRILLTHSPQDYMEDHMNTARLAVTAAFSRGMPNYRTRPSRPAVDGPVTVYHALPHGLRDGLRRRVRAGLYVDTTPVHPRQREALACHASQKAWLDRSQGMDSYLHTFDDFSRAVGRLSRRFTHAEGWRRHSHLGFCGESDDPLAEALGGAAWVDPAYERSLDR